MKYSLINKSIKSIALTASAVLALTVQQSAFSADANSGAFFGNPAPGKWIIGPKFANVDPNTPGDFAGGIPGFNLPAENTDIEIGDADTAGIVIGYEFATTIGNLGGSSSVEFEYLTGDDDLPQFNTNYDIDVASLFFTYRTAGKLFFKAKGGVTFTNLEVETFGVLQDFSDTSLGLGVGLGYRVGDLGTVEVEYSTDSGDADVDVVGVNALFQF